MLKYRKKIIKEFFFYTKNVTSFLLLFMVSTVHDVTKYDKISVISDTCTLYIYYYCCFENFHLTLITNMEKIHVRLTIQIEEKPQHGSISNYNSNCPKCGFVYKSLRSYGPDNNATVIQIIECLQCNYSWKESWQLPMWRSYHRASSDFKEL